MRRYIVDVVSLAGSERSRPTDTTLMERVAVESSKCRLELWLSGPTTDAKELKNSAAKAVVSDDSTAWLLNSWRQRLGTRDWQLIMMLRRRINEGWLGDSAPSWL